MTLPGPIELPPEGEVHLWHVSLDVSENVRLRCLDSLEPSERARMERFKFDRHQRRFATRRAALRQILGGYLGIAAGEVRFRYSEYRKPEIALPTEPRVRFNLSDSGDLAVVAVTQSADIGVDIEIARPLRDMEAVARRAFSTREFEELFSLDPEDRLAAFYACWTRKEAWLKARGEGIIGNLGGFSVSLRPGEVPALLEVEDDPGAPGRWVLRAWTPGAGVVGAVALEVLQEFFPLLVRPIAFELT